MGNALMIMIWIILNRGKIFKQIIWKAVDPNCNKKNVNNKKATSSKSNNIMKDIDPNSLFEKFPDFLRNAVKNTNCF